MYSVAALVLVQVAVAAAGGRGVNYCGAAMCGHTDAHTLCQFPAGPSASCVALVPAPLTAEEKTGILARLNQRRSDAAAGALPRLPSAGNMLQLRWVEELALEAQRWADQCRPVRSPEEHDACRDLFSVSVGQCVASVVGPAPGLRAASLVDTWFLQGKHYSGDAISYQPPNSSRHYYGDFAQITWARAFMVGCGRSRFMTAVRGALQRVERLVCNVAPAGPRRALWAPAPPAAACPARARPSLTYPALCDYQRELNEPKDLDASMTIEDHILLNTLFEIDSNETLREGSLDEIYLTYLAIVTMANTEATTLRINSMQKRDIVKVKYYNSKSTPTTSNQFSEWETAQNSSLKSNSINPKIISIGRPKAYKMEELSANEGEHKPKNHDTTEVVLKRKKDFYYDYIMEALDDNTITTEESVLEKDVKENHTFEERTYVKNPSEMNDTETTKIITALVMDETSTDVYEAVKSKNNQDQLNETTAANGTLALNDDMDQYLSDPETVRQIEEALNRLEHQASNTSSSTRKMRRDVPEELPPESTSIDPSNLEGEEDLAELRALAGEPIDPAASVTPDNPDGNNSSDVPPVLGVMLKYMPYLNNYENKLLRQTTAASTIHLSSLTSTAAAITLCLMSCVDAP